MSFFNLNNSFAKTLKKYIVMRKGLLLLLLQILLPMVASAYVEIDGIYYIFNNNEATVTCNGNPDYSWYPVYEGDVVIPSTVTYNGISYTVSSIGKNAFSFCSNLLSITIPNSITTIGDNAFQNCSGLTSIDMPSTITSIGIGAFMGCTGLTEVIIPNSVISIESNAFQYCSNLTSIEIPNSISAMGLMVFDETPWYTNYYNNHPDGIVYLGSVAYTYKGAIPSGTLIIKNGTLGIAAWAFHNRSELTSISIPKSVKNIGGGAFGNCNGLTNIVLPDSLKAIVGSAFMGCTGLTKVEFPRFLEYIGLNAFEACKNIRSFIFSGSIINIDMQAFSGCSSLTSIYIPNTAKTIGDRAFSGCTSLQRIELPSSLESIGINVFQRCNNVSSLILAGEGEFQGSNLSIPTKPVVYIDSKITAIKGLGLKPSQIWSYATIPPICDESTFDDYSGSLHVPASALATYFTAPYWGSFANIIGNAVEPNVTISNDTVEMSPGEVFSLTSSVFPADATPTTYVSWTTTNSSVAIVDENNGNVTAIGAGECDIIARCLHKTAICHIVVKDVTVVIYLDQHNVRIRPNEIITLTPSSSINILPELVVSSSNPSIAAARVVNNIIQVVGVQPGTAIITVGSVDGLAQTDSCFVTVYSDTIKGDVNGDGEVNIADINAVIDIILSGSFEINGDVNADGEINIADINAVIDQILTN